MGETEGTTPDTEDVTPDTKDVTLEGMETPYKSSSEESIELEAQVAAENQSETSAENTEAKLQCEKEVM